MQSWQDEGRPDSFVSVVKDGNASRRKQAGTSPSGRIILNLQICDWSAVFGVTGSTLDCIVGTMRADPVKEIKGGIWNRMHAGTGRRLQHLGSPRVTSEDILGRTLIVVWASELQQNPMVYVLIAEAVLDSSGNPLVGLVGSDSNFVMTEPGVVPKGTWTFRVGEVGTTTVTVISFNMSVQRAAENAHVIGPGDSKLGLNFTPVVLVDEGWIVTFSVVVWKLGMFHRAFNTKASPLSSTGHVALSRPATLHVVTPYSEEPLEDLLIPDIGSTNSIQSNFALCFTKGVLASTDWNRRIRVRAHSVGLSIPLDKMAEPTC